MAGSFKSSTQLNENNGICTPLRRRANTVLAKNGDTSFKGCSARHVNNESVVQCRFSYASWCPICENEEGKETKRQEGRRRSKSEGMDIEKSDEYYDKASSIEMLKMQSHLNYKKNYQYPTANKSSDYCDYYLSPQKVHHSHSLVQPVSQLNVNCDEKIMIPISKPCENHLEPNRGFYKTWNYIEKVQTNFSIQKDDRFRPLHERYYNEVESLRNKLHKLKDTNTSTERSKLNPCHEFLAPNLSSIEVGLKRPRDNSLPVNRPTNSHCSSLKHLPTTSSSKIYHSKSALCSKTFYILSSESCSSVTSDSDYNDSGCEEEDLKDGCELESEEDENDFLASPKGGPLSSVSTSHYVNPSSIVKTENAQSLVVPNNLHPGLRASLFSHVPPYIRFSTHDVKGFDLPSTIQKLLKWKLSTITPVVVRKTIANSNFKLVRKSNEWCGTWGKHMKSLCFKTLREYQKINHFPGTFQIGRKDRLWKNLFRLMTKFGKKEFGFIPRTYVLPQDSKLLRSAWEKNCGKEKWIVKPPASARGTGIKVIHKWTQIPKKCPLVVQKYISDPYLINGSKFDLRLYVLVTSINPMRIYLFDNGLVRFASVKYSNEMTSLADRYMHLTNYSINKLSSQYTQNEDASACQGHKWSLKAMWSYLEKERQVDVKAIKNNLVDLVIKTIISGESAISQLSHTNLASRYCSYELFGVDVLLDEWLKPWLLEVNISPSLHSSSPLDLAVKGPLVRDLMNIAGYQIPNKLSCQVQTELAESLGVQSDLCFDRRLYTTALSNEERLKHVTFQQTECRDDYLETILQNLTPDDIRHLIQYEDELTQIGNFQKIFPTSQSYDYQRFFEAPRYYNMLFDAWEIKQSKDRTKGIMLLESLCKKQVHLDTTQIPPKRTKLGFYKGQGLFGATSSLQHVVDTERNNQVCMSPSENCLKNINQDLAEDIPEVLEEDTKIVVHSKIRNKWSIPLVCGTICRAARPRSGKPGLVTKPYPRSSYIARRSIKSADSFS